MTSSPLAIPLPRNRWIISPAADLMLVIGTPLLLLAALVPLSWNVPDAQFPLIFVTLLSIGHHLPGFLRIYGDRELFARFRFRALAIPPLLFMTVYGLTVRRFGAVLMVILLWGFWHGLMQIYGFMRIYDAKVGRTDRVTARLDWLMCAACFVAALFGSATNGRIYVEAAEATGIPYLALLFEPPLPAVALALASAMALVYAGYTVWTFTTPRPVSGAKLLLLAVTAAFLYFSWVLVQTNRWLGLGAWELFHDIQYFAIVWSYNCGLAKREAATRFCRFLFRPRATLAAVYVGLILAYGAISYVPQGSYEAVIPSLLATSVLLHFYFDGFIWKVRQAKTQRDLDLNSEGRNAPAPVPVLPRPSWLREAVHVACFAAPMLMLPMLESFEGRWELPMRRSLVRLRPDAATFHEALGRAYCERRMLPQAVEQLEHALALAPGSASVHYELGLAHLERGDRTSANEHFSAAGSASVKSLTRPRHTVFGRGSDDPPRELLGSHAHRMALQRRPGEGIRALENALVAGSGDAHLADLLARLLIDDDDPSARPRAVAWAEKACVLTRRRHPPYLLTLARAHAAQGDAAKAVEVAAEARRQIEPTGFGALRPELDRVLATSANARTPQRP